MRCPGSHMSGKLCCEDLFLEQIGLDLSCLRHTPNVTFYLDVLKYCGMIHAYLVLAIIGTGL